MLKGLYTAAAGMRARLEMQDVNANNLANASTPGFQREIASVFMRKSQPLAQVSSPWGARRQVDTLLTKTNTDHRPGALEQTGVANDVAIDGPGYLVAQTAGGPRLFRGGTLRVNVQGELANQMGQPVMDTRGQAIKVGTKPFTIDQAGNVMSSGKKIATLKVATANAMQREGNNQFSAKQLQDAPAGSFRVLQNYREHSNVNTVGEMVDMLAGMRAYEAAQKSVVAQDSSLEELLSVLRK